MLGIGTYHLRVQLGAQGVKLSLREECIEDFVCDASEAVARTRKTGEPYLSCLRRHIDARVRFILLWTHTDERFDRAEWKDLVAIAQKNALPRPWRGLPEPVGLQQLTVFSMRRA
jgi:hypothetical protein